VFSVFLGSLSLKEQYVPDGSVPQNGCGSLVCPVTVNCVRLLAEVNEECGQGYISSSSDGEDFAGQPASKTLSRWPQQKLQTSVDVLEYTTSAVRDTFAPKLSPQHHVLKATSQGPQMSG